MATAFVLAGGGSLGTTEVGLPAALTGAGVRPDFMVGTSVGAANAAWFALHPRVAGRGVPGQCRSHLRPAVGHVSRSSPCGAATTAPAACARRRSRAGSSAGSRTFR
ncbi:patatin-like phospholipase family protein [Streptomyces sp. ID05-26A]|nr:patatin-like phospholipase family protein [Streptomyces sp. ID05-26A]